MSEAQTTDATPETPAQATETAAEAPKVEDIDWKAKARDWERRAKENKTAADELAAIKEAQKTEAEKAADTLRAAQAEAEQARASLLRYKTAAEHGITDADDIALFLTGTDEETLTRQAQRLAERSQSDGRPRSPRPDTTQGRQGESGPRSTADSFAEFFRNTLPER